MTRRFFPALAFVVLTHGAAPALAQDALVQVRTRGVLRWGGDIQGGEPYAFRDPHDSARLVGFEVEIADALAHRLGGRAEFVQNDWSTLIPSLERGDFDVILNGLEVTAARRERVAFTRPYYAFSETFVVRRDDGALRSLDDLRGRRVGTLAASLGFELLRARPGVEVVLYEGVEEPYIDLEQGRLDGVVLDNIIADRYGLVRPTLRAAATVGEGTYAIAIRPADKALLQAVDTALGEMRRAGELRAILTRWSLWNERQERLSEVAPAAATQAAPGAVTVSQLLLFLHATGFTVLISTLAMGLAVAGGLVLSVARRYGGAPLRFAATTYVELFRGTPVLLQLYVLYYGLAPLLTLNAFTAAVVGLGMNYAAYESELYRAGLQAVPIGQTEAALSLGMSRRLTLRRIVLPQALRVALPGIANDFIALLKDSSLVSVITVVELTKQMTITAVDVRSWAWPGLLCAGLYLALSYPLSRLARRLERRLVPVPA
ncbi:MAG TPA: ABC transporter substrate-binding protein/permease [Candidatus Margulisiibacteriota bacterium]|nr:ABC transporter substrate-binding protein/permease [Candidatus Margulisiibacteriota bacterium]